MDQKAKEEYSKKLHVEALKALHMTATVAIFYLFWLLFRYGRISFAGDVGYRYNYYVAIGYTAMIHFFNRTYNSYLLGYTRIRMLVFFQFLSQFFSAAIIWLVVCIAWDHFQNPSPFFCAICIQLVLDIFWSYHCNGAYFRLYPAKRTILIYRGELDKKRFGTIAGKPTERLYQIVEEFRYEGNKFNEIREKLEGFDAVFVAGVHSRCRNEIAKYCKDKNITGFFLPLIGDVIMQEAQHIQSFDAPVLFVTKSSPKPEYRILKRAFDILLSFSAMIILSPLFLVTALAIRLYDGGPAIYKQTRLTRGGKEFQIWKFRSMCVDAEKDGIARLSTGDNDSRITPVGRLIRRFRIDELPQLVNIFLGDMSFVGPRPERPEIAEQYCSFLPDFSLRLQVKAGLTGYAQVYGKYNIDPYEKLAFDLLYINNMSILTDLQLIFATLGLVFKKDSTEGITVDQITAVNYGSEALRADNDA